MFCISCRATLPDGANFCSHCGAAQNNSSHDGTYEYCVLRQDMAAKNLRRLVHCRYYAVGKDDHGSEYLVTQPGAWVESSRANEKAIERLVKELTQAGWENTTLITRKTGYYHEYRFRRKRKT